MIHKLKQGTDRVGRAGAAILSPYCEAKKQLEDVSALLQGRLDRGRDMKQLFCGRK
jgi:hypothetical protein